MGHADTQISIYLSPSMNSIPHIATPYSEPWVAWLLFLLGLLLILSSPAFRSPREVMRTLTSHSERSYAANNRNLLTEIISVISRVGVLALTFYMLVCSAGCAFTLLNYAKVAGVVVAVLTLQALLIYAVGSVFLSSRQLSQALEQYSFIRNLTGVLLWGVMLLMTNWACTPALYILCGIVLTLFSVAILGKGILMFYTGIPSLLYILLYFISLEIVPLCGTFLWAKQIV